MPKQKYHHPLQDLNKTQSVEIISKCSNEKKALSIQQTMKISADIIRQLAHANTKMVHMLKLFDVDIKTTTVFMTITNIL